MVDELVGLVERGHELAPATIDTVTGAIDAGERPAEILEDVIWRHRNIKVAPKTVNQKRYVDSIRRHTVTFGIGPAGTGKTFLAVAMAVAALEARDVSRIILTRPAVEAGERLGFLPGDIQAKVDPYLRPLFDALYDMLDPERVLTYLDRGVIEVAPLAFMRGRTLNDSFVILDEAQNTSPEQMKMFLTRLGFGSKMVVTGDITQIDLPRDQRSGPDRRRRDPRRRSTTSPSSASAARTSSATSSCSGSSPPTTSTRERAEARIDASTSPTSPASCVAAVAGGARGRGGRRRPPLGRARRRGADPRAQPRAPRARRAHRRALVPDRRRRAGRRARASSATSSICPEHTADVVEATVHGVLHLCGYDHETDDGEMLALQAEILERRDRDDARAGLRRARRAARTSASRRSSTRSSAPRSRSSPTARRPPGGRAGASPPTSPAGWQLVLVDLPGRPAAARRAHRADAAPGRARARRTPTRSSSSSTASRASGPGDRFIAGHLLGGGASARR